MLNSYSLCSTGNFPTRINSDSSSVIDNISIDISKVDDYETITFLNGLSDYDAQFIILNNIQIKPNEYQSYFKRKSNALLQTFKSNQAMKYGILLLMVLKW